MLCILLYTANNGYLAEPVNGKSTTLTVSLLRILIDNSCFMPVFYEVNKFLFHSKMWIATIACVAAARSSDVPTVSSDGADLVLAAAPGGRIILSTINEKGVCAYVDLHIFY